MLYIYVLCGLASAFAGRSVDPLTSLIGGDFGLPVERAALISTVFAFPFALSQPVLGPLGDFYGKRLVLKICLWLLVLFLIACELSPTFQLLIVARLLAGVASGGVMPVVMAMVADAYPPATRQLAIGRFVTASLMGTVLGASVAGVMAVNFGWRSFFLLAACLTLAAAAAVTFVLPRPEGETRPTTRIRLSDATSGYAKVFANPKTFLCFGAVFVEGLCFFGVTPYVGSLLQEAGHGGAQEAGFVIGAFGVGGVAYSLLLPLLLRLLRRATMMAAGGAILAIGLIGLALALPWPVVAILFAASGFGFMLLHNSIQTEVASLAPSARASAFALHSCSFFLGQALGPLVTGPGLSAFGPAFLFVFALALALLGFIVSRLFRRFPTASGRVFD